MTMQIAGLSDVREWARICARWCPRADDWCSVGCGFDGFPVSRCSHSGGELMRCD